MVDDGRRSQAKRFLELQFGEALEADKRLKFLITSIEPLTDEEKKGRKALIRTQAFSKINDESLEYIFRQCDEVRMDTYACMGLVRDVPPPGRRSTEEVVFAITSMWQDFDVFTKGLSKKPNYPPTFEDAGKLVNIGPHQPSHRVLSGYGIHGYWRLLEPWTFETAEGRAAAKSASHRVHLTFQDRAALDGWVLDATYDLVRIMRVPGTLNYKRREEPREVILEEPVQERRFDFDGDLEQYLVDEQFSGSVERPKHRWEVTVGYLQVDASRGLPRRVNVLLTNDEEFVESWHSRAKINDMSPSGYDMSCVNFMVRAGLNDQEIADAIAFRRQHVEEKGDRSKGARLGYIQGTIGKVRMDTKPEDLLGDLGQPAAPPIDHDGNVVADQLVDADRERHLELLRSLLKIHVLRYIQEGRDEPQNYLETPDGRLKLGTTTELFKFDEVSENLWKQHDIPLSEDLRKSWKKIVKQVMSPLKEVDETTESTKVDKMYVLLQQYTEDSRPEPEENMRKAISSSRPFLEGVLVWIRLPDFKRILGLQRERFFRSQDEAISLFKEASEFTSMNGSLYNKGKNFLGDNGKRKRYFPFAVVKIDQGSAGDPEVGPFGEEEEEP